MRRAGWAAAVAATIGLSSLASPASAQFFLKSRDIAGGRVTGAEPGLGSDLPDATPAERRAALTWNLRAGLNVAALQCQFEPTLQTVWNYNAILLDHRDELKKSLDTLTAYFVRVNKDKKAGQAALDQFGTRVYSSYATVSAQYNFCQTANDVGREAVFASRGTFGDVAELRMRELRNSLVPYGEQMFPSYVTVAAPTMPRLDPICWDKKGRWITKVCGAQNWPPVGTGVASR